MKHTFLESVLVISLLPSVSLTLACTGDDRGGDSDTSVVTSNGVQTQGSSSSSTTSTTGDTTGDPWGGVYQGHYGPPGNCRPDEVEGPVGMGFGCLPGCVGGLCPPPPPGTKGVPACVLDLDDSIPGPDHCAITCAGGDECQGFGYNCHGDVCGWP